MQWLLLFVCGLSSCGAWVSSPCRACGNLPKLGMEPVSPTLAGRFLTTGPPGKPLQPLEDEVKKYLAHGPSSRCPPLSFCLSVQESFFTPFAARGRGSQWKGGESNFSMTPRIPQPHLKQPEWLSTQDCPQDQKRSDKTGANRDCPRCLCAGEHTHPHPRVCWSLFVFL